MEDWDTLNPDLRHSPSTESIKRYIRNSNRITIISISEAFKYIVDQEIPRPNWNAMLLGLYSENSNSIFAGDQSSPCGC